MSLKYTMLLYYCVAVLASLGASPASAQDNCVDVLKYTGRESKVVYDSDVGRRFMSYAHARSREAGGDARIPIEGIPASFGFDYADDSSTTTSSFSEWERRYFEDALTVFGPAVQAWSACKKAERDNIRFIPSIGADGRLLIRLLKPSGIGIRFNGAIYDQQRLLCRRGSRVINRSTRFAMPDSELVVECTRRQNTYDPAVVHLSLSNETYSVTMPRAPRRARSYRGDSSDDVRTFTACSSTVAIGATGYDRTVAFKNITMNGRFDVPPSTGKVEATINGEVVTFASAPTPAGANPRGSISAPDDTHTIPAFMPALVKVYGGIHGGTCESMSGLLRLPG